MPVILPRSTWAWKSLASLRSGTLMTFFCLLCLAAGSPVQQESKKTHHRRSSDIVKRAPERPAAHFQADTQKNGTLTWINNIDNSFTQGHLTLQDNQLHIEQMGLYFIYAQATFGGSKCPEKNKNLVTLSVILKSTVRNENMQILHADKTPCELSQAVSTNVWRWNKPIFQGGVFRLEKGDILFVDPTGKEYLNLSGEGANYFGAYAL